MADSKSFLSPKEILPIAQAQENKIFKEIFLFYYENVYCVYSLESPHEGASNEYTHYTIIYRRSKDMPKLSPSASWPGAVITPQWAKLPMPRTNFRSPKDAWTIAVWLYI